jgi:hypothetical protein
MYTEQPSAYFYYEETNIIVNKLKYLGKSKLCFFFFLKNYVNIIYKILLNNFLYTEFQNLQFIKILVFFENETRV